MGTRINRLVPDTPSDPDSISDEIEEHVRNELGDRSPISNTVSILQKTQSRVNQNRSELSQSTAY